MTSFLRLIIATQALPGLAWVCSRLCSCFQMDRWNTAEAKNISIVLIEVWVVSITYTGMTLQC